MRGLEPQFGIAADDSADAVAISSQGLMYTLGKETTTLRNGQGRSSTFAVLSRFDRTGSKLWATKIDLNCAYSADDVPKCGEYALDPEVDGAGNAYTYVGTTTTEHFRSGDDLLTEFGKGRASKFSSAGKPLWERTILQKDKNAGQRYPSFFAAAEFSTTSQGQSYVAFNIYDET